jgi:hypothetical protein
MQGLMAATGIRPHAHKGKPDVVSAISYRLLAIAADEIGLPQGTANFLLDQLFLIFAGDEIAA